MLCLIEVKNFKVFKELATIHHCDLLVSVGRESHGEPATVLGEDRRLLQLQPAARRCHDQVVLAVAPVESVFSNRLEKGKYLSLGLFVKPEGFADGHHTVVLVPVLPGERHLVLGEEEKFDMGLI